ncbi:MAG: fumarylacetoacetate hydrolase family protein [Candidatus Aureabacteria bacterium]|nr:fumarylacetoacetate hydrolase family protein [Candidatus Auribacterota bacterium]
MKIFRVGYKGCERWSIEDEESNLILCEGSPFTKLDRTGPVVRKESVKILPPSTPSKIVAVGLNYTDHARELNMDIPSEPIIFMKPLTSVIGHEENIVYPPMSERVDYEAELGIIIKKIISHADEKTAKAGILGFCCANDVTARDLQKKDGQWTRAKSFNTFCPFGPCCSTDIEPDNLSIKLRRNGRVLQDSNTSNFIFKTGYVVSFISKVMTLHPGDLILTGTPAGVGPVGRNDILEVDIENIGVLRNKVV